jgi:peptidoglycan/xylan/chitin deacetylase (PgdA/CDA1 family)
MSSFAAQSAAFSRFVTLLEQARGEASHLLRVLTYHHVERPEARPALYPGLISATPEAFEQQMAYVAANYDVVSMPELLDAWRTGAALPFRPVMVTFDDAYRDFAEYAWPILNRYRLPVTLFVPTAFPDHPEQTFWWDRLYQALASTSRDHLATPEGQLPLATAAQRLQTYRRLRDYVKSRPHAEAMAWVAQVCDELGAPPPEHNVLSWEALRRLAREGVTLGAHTRTHPLMNRVSLDEVRAEAVGSLRDLEREIGSALPVFAYPSGGLNDEIVQLLEREGFALAFTTLPGINDMRRVDPLRLRRINVGQRTNLTVLRARLLPWTRFLNRWQPLLGA